MPSICEMNISISFFFYGIIVQSLSGLRAMDKRHLTLSIPFLFCILLFDSTHVETYDTITRLTIQLTFVFDIVRRNSFEKSTIKQMIMEYTLYVTFSFIYLSISKSVIITLSSRISDVVIWVHRLRSLMRQAWIEWYPEGETYRSKAIKHHAPLCNYLPSIELCDFV